MSQQNNDDKARMRDVFNLLIFVTLGMFFILLTQVRMEQPNVGWGWLYWPLVLAAYALFEKIKEDYNV